MPDLPLLNALNDHLGKFSPGFHTPGHHAGQGIAPNFQELWHRHGLKLDISEVPGLDNLAAPAGILQDSQKQAAETFGADYTWFLVNGSTVGIIAAILATCGPGDWIIVPRNCHQSVLSGIILAGANPLLVTPKSQLPWGLSLPLLPGQVAQALNHCPQAKAVLLVSPTYEGLGTDLAAIAEMVHQAGLTLIVDEAHGSHFNFHPAFSQTALQAGADLVIQSTHKTLSALTQAAMLHQQGTRVSPDRISQCLRLLQSSSPSYLLLASLEAACTQMAIQGEPLWQNAVTLAQSVQLSATRFAPLRLLNSADLPPTLTLDPCRLTLGTWPLQLTGFLADDYLTTGPGVIAELPTWNYLTFLLGLGHTPTDGERLIAGWEHLVQHFGSEAGRDPLHPGAWQALQLMIQYPPNLPELAGLAIKPQTAFFSPQQTVNATAAIGEICGEWVCPYPPGIPLLWPGEEITAPVLAQLQALHQAGATMTGCSDRSLKTLQIL